MNELCLVVGLLVFFRKKLSLNWIDLAKTALVALVAVTLAEDAWILGAQRLASDLGLTGSEYWVLHPRNAAFAEAQFSGLVSLLWTRYLLLAPLLTLTIVATPLTALWINRRQMRLSSSQARRIAGGVIGIVLVVEALSSFVVVGLAVRALPTVLGMGLIWTLEVGLGTIWVLRQLDPPVGSSGRRILLTASLVCFLASWLATAARPPIRFGGILGLGLAYAVIIAAMLIAIRPPAGQRATAGA